MSKPLFPSENFRIDPTFPIQSQCRFLFSNQNLKTSKKPMKNPDNQIPIPQTHEFFDTTNVTHSSLQTEPLQNEGRNTKNVVQHLVLENFKLNECPFQIQHNHKSCPFFHNFKDKKRPGTFYSAELCEYVEKELTCPKGDLCTKSHNRVEQLYRLDKYKKKFCSLYPNYLDKCEYGVFCSFAHNENDILVELIHNLTFDDDFYMFKYKTIWCPFNLTQHEMKLCVYAHNWQDYRRPPHLYQYEPLQCPNWKCNDYIINYSDGCKNQLSCNKCHGWKENEYHPLNYKTKPCEAGKNCTKGKDCPYFHNDSDKRVISSEIIYNIFKFFPKNRIVTNTFKTIVSGSNQSLPINANDLNSNDLSIAWVGLNLNEKNDQQSLTETNYLDLEKKENENQDMLIKDDMLLQSHSLNALPNFSNKRKSYMDFFSNQNDVVYPNSSWNKKGGLKNQIPSQNYQMTSSQTMENNPVIRSFSPELSKMEQKQVKNMDPWMFNPSMVTTKSSINTLGAPNSGSVTTQANLLKLNQYTQQMHINQMHAGKQWQSISEVNNNQKIQMNMVNQLNNNPLNSLNRSNSGIMNNSQKYVSFANQDANMKKAFNKNALNVNSVPFSVNSNANEIENMSHPYAKDDLLQMKLEIEKHAEGDYPNKTGTSRIKFWTQNENKFDNNLNQNNQFFMKNNDSFDFKDENHSLPKSREENDEENSLMKLSMEKEKEELTENEINILKNICEEDNDEK